MSSREIAELTAKEHKNVCADIRKMLGDLGEDALKFQRIYLDSMNREQTEFALDRELTDVLLTGYSAVLRRKVIARWRELEAAALPAPAKAARAAEPKPPVMVAASMMPTLVRALRCCGIDKNAAAIGANQIATAQTGVNLLAMAGHTHLPTPTQQICYTPTELGKRFCQSAITFNRRLADAGLQESIAGHWVPTEKGRRHAVVLDTGKTHGSGTPIQQVKWADSVLAEIAL